jgi:hypothetical protein
VVGAGSHGFGPLLGQASRSILCKTQEEIAETENVASGTIGEMATKVSRFRQPCRFRESLDLSGGHAFGGKLFMAMIFTASQHRTVASVLRKKARKAPPQFKLSLLIPLP